MDATRPRRIRDSARRGWYARWRTVHPKAACAAYQNHVERCAQIPDIDFVPCEQTTGSKSTQPVDENNTDDFDDVLAAVLGAASVASIHDVVCLTFKAHRLRAAREMVAQLGRSKARLEVRCSAMLGGVCLTGATSPLRFRARAARVRSVCRG